MLYKYLRAVFGLVLLLGCALCAHADMVGFWNFDNSNIGYNSITGTVDLGLQGSGGQLVSGQFVSGGLGYLAGTGTNGSIANLPVGNSAYTISLFVNSSATTNANGKSKGMGFMGWGGYGSGYKVTAFRAFESSSDKNSGLDVYWWAADMEKLYDSATWGSKVNSGFMNHVATLYDGTSRGLYLNGQLVGFDTPSHVREAENKNFKLGATSLDSDGIFSGTMDNASLYSNALTQMDMITLAGSRYNGLVSQWVNTDATGSNKIDRVSGKVFSADASAGTRLTSPTQTLQFSRTLTASENAFYSGQIAAGHTFQTDAAPSAWTAANTAWVRTVSATWDGSATPLGIYVGGTTTQATLTTTTEALNKSNLTLLLGGGQLALSANTTSQAAPFTQTFIVDGGLFSTPVGTNFFMGGASRLSVASGTAAFNGQLILNGTAAVEQVGGRITYSAELNMGSVAGTNATFVKSGGTLNGTTLNLGMKSGNAVFVHDGGTTSFTGWFTIADYESTGSFFMNGGTISGKTGLFGNRNVGTYTQTAGNATFTTLAVGGDGSGGRGTLTLSGGTLTVTDSSSGMIVGNVGRGFVNQTGGTLITPVLKLQNTLDDKAGAAYKLSSNGTLRATTLTNAEKLDFAGGTLFTTNVNGNMTQAGGTLTGLGDSLTLNGNYTQNAGVLLMANNLGTVTINGSAVLNGLGLSTIPTVAQLNNQTTINVTGDLTVSEDALNCAEWWQMTRTGNTLTIAVKNDAKNTLNGAYYWKGGDGTFNDTTKNWTVAGADVTTTPTTTDTAIIQSGSVNLSTTSAADQLWVDGTATVNAGDGSSLAGIGTVHVLKGGTFIVSTSTNANFVVDGGKVISNKFFSAGTDVTLNSGSIAVTEFRIGNNATTGSLVMNGGELTTTWLTLGESDSTSSNRSTLEVNGGTLTSNGVAAIMVGRGGTSSLTIKDGTVNANGYSTFVSGALIVGSHNTGSVVMDGGTLNVSGQGLNLQGHSASFVQNGGTVNITNVGIGGSFGLNIADGTSYRLLGGELNTYKITGNFTQEGGELSPGGKNTLADLTITGDYALDDGTITLTMNSTQDSPISGYKASDLVLVNGNASFDSVFNPVYAEGSVVDDSSWYLFFASKNEIDFGHYGSFEAWNEASTNSFSYEYLINANLLDGYSYYLVGHQVPEPASWSLLLLSGGLLWVWRRKKV